MPSELPDRASSHDPLDETEQEALLRLTRVVGRVFRVPVAYMALLGPDMTVAGRIGSGSQYWQHLAAFPLAATLAKPGIWPVAGQLRFAASAPLRASDGLELGTLMIADTAPRPKFSAWDLDTLSELAGVLAGKMELRISVCLARQAELALREAEGRFRSIANAAPVMIICSGIDGAPMFVNKAWLEFTGRTLEDEIVDGFAEMFHPDCREAALKRYWDAFRNRQPLSQEIRMRRHDGEYRSMLTQGRPRFQDDGTFAGYIGCFVDVTGQGSGEPPTR